MPVLVVLFLSFLLNIYMCMYSYTNLTIFYNIFTIIDNLHCSLALFSFSFFFSQYAGFACVFKYYMCIHNYTDATNFYNIFIIIDNVHCLLALFFFHNTLVLLVLLIIICAYTITLMQQIFTIFSQSRDLSSL